MLSDNNREVVELFKSRGDNFPVTVRDFAGWIFIAGCALAVSAWALGWVEGLVTAILSVIVLAAFLSLFLAYPVSQIRFRKEPRPQHLYAQYKNRQQG